MTRTAGGLIFGRYGDHKTDYSYSSVLERSIGDTVRSIKLPILGFKNTQKQLNIMKMGVVA